MLMYLWHPMRLHLVPHALQYLLKTSGILEWDAINMLITPVRLLLALKEMLKFELNADEETNEIQFVS